MKRLFVGIVAYIIIVVLLYWGISFSSNLRVIPDDLRNFATYFAGMLALITTPATIYITYAIYILSNLDHKAESYFEKLVNLYVELLETRQKLNSEDDDGIRIKLIQRIRFEVRLMRYYVHRFPDKSHSVKSLDLTLNDLWFEPEVERYYDALSYEMESFCFHANRKEERPVYPIKDSKGGVIDIDY